MKPIVDDQVEASNTSANSVFVCECLTRVCVCHCVCTLAQMTPRLNENHNLEKV